MITLGYRVTLSVGGKTFELHTNQKWIVRRNRAKLDSIVPQKPRIGTVTN